MAVSSPTGWDTFNVQWNQRSPCLGECEGWQKTRASERERESERQESERLKALAVCEQQSSSSGAATAVARVEFAERSGQRLPDSVPTAAAVLPPAAL